MMNTNLSSPPPPFLTSTSPSTSNPIHSPLSSKYADRPNRGKIEEILNKNDIPRLLSTETSKPVVCEVALVPDQLQKGYRYMFEKLADKGDILDERIEQLGHEIASAYEFEQICHPGQPSQAQMTTYGRICCEVLSVEGLDGQSMDAKLSETTVMLESSRDVGSGERVKLQLDSLTTDEGYALFPGQIVGIEGINSSGKLINVSKIFTPPLLPMTVDSMSTMREYYPSDSNGNPSVRPVNIIIASGPYTLEDSLEYEPLQDLIQDIILKEKPDVVILMGPFIDSNHPMIEEGDLDLLFEELFAKQISQRLDYVHSLIPDTQFILIPSIRDAVSEYFVYPQPPLGSTLTSSTEGRLLLGLPDWVICYPNPAQFYINDMLFAISSVDTLQHLSKTEIAWQPKPTLSSHLSSSSTSMLSQSTHMNNTNNTMTPHTNTSINTNTNTNTNTNINVSTPIPKDRMSRLVQHILSQRSLYPIFPPVSGEVSLDLAVSMKEISLKATPDVLIISSALNRFSKIIHDVVVINPGMLCRGRSGGTFARMTVHPLVLGLSSSSNSNNNNELKRDNHDDDDRMEMDKENTYEIKKEKNNDEKEEKKIKQENEENEGNEEEEDMIDHHVSKRCRVEIQRI